MLFQYYLTALPVNPLLQSLLSLYVQDFYPSYTISLVSHHTCLPLMLPFIQPKILSDMNLSAYLQWANLHQAEAAQLVPWLYMKVHTDCYGINSSPIGIQLQGQKYTIPERRCTIVGCGRCGNNGGYSFQWYGPWSYPSHIVQEGESPNEARVRVYSQ